MGRLPWWSITRGVLLDTGSGTPAGTTATDLTAQWVRDKSGVPRIFLPASSHLPETAQPAKNIGTKNTGTKFLTGRGAIL